MNHLERSLDHQNQWWKYLVVFVSAFLATNLIGAIPLIAVIVYKVVKSGGSIIPSNNIADLSVYGISQNLGLILMLLPFLVGLLTFILLLRPLHKRTYKEVINGTHGIRWNKFFNAIIIWSILTVPYLAVSFMMNPSNFQLNFNASSFVILLPISFLLIPFQAAYEEILFRGYFSQGIAAWTRNRWFVLFIPALFFGLMHVLNPEVKEYGFWLSMPQYWLFGLLLGLVTILDDGIETAMGLHAANNILTSILITTKASALQTPALFFQQKVHPVLEIIMLAALGVLFVIILGAKYKWKFSVLGKPVRKQEEILV